MLHEHFGVAVSPGLSDVLSGECAWSEAVVQTGIPNLHLLPCGYTPRNPGSLFAQARHFIAEVGGQYDYCLFDTTPVLVADDVLAWRRKRTGSSWSSAPDSLPAASPRPRWSAARAQSQGALAWYSTRSARSRATIIITGTKTTTPPALAAGAGTTDRS